MSCKLVALVGLACVLCAACAEEPVHGEHLEGDVSLTWAGRDEPPEYGIAAASEDADGNATGAITVVIGTQPLACGYAPSAQATLGTFAMFDLTGTYPQRYDGITVRIVHGSGSGTNVYGGPGLVEILEMGPEVVRGTVSYARDTDQDGTVGVQGAFTVKLCSPLP